jgi:hypothetical protein
VAGAIFTGLGGAEAGRALTVAASTAVPVLAPEIVALQHTFLAGFRAALTVAAGLSAVGTVAALVRGDEGRSNHAVPPDQLAQEFASPPGELRSSSTHLER